ncbi:MLP-like protein 43 [Primulina eburnea]|uniref:MLP-like protein 43 n=1 Tax=Primulina eburnea TaxID=1245227 RepID=UPI003C6BFD91
MAGLPCKLIAQVAFKAGGDVFHHLISNKPHHLSNVTPGKIQACELHQGDYGTNGSVILWKYTFDSKPPSLKFLGQDIDEVKKTISYKMLEGDLLKYYKNMLITMHVETRDRVDFVTWTVEYELLKPENQHPISLIGFFIDLTKEVETHIFG